MMLNIEIVCIENLRSHIWSVYTSNATAINYYERLPAITAVNS